MSKVATRTANTGTSTGQRPYPVAPANSRMPPAASGAVMPYASSRMMQNDLYRVDSVVKDGVRSEVLVIEDTPPPPPFAGPSGSGSGSSSYNSHYDPQPGYEPAPKKRRADGAQYDRAYPNGADGPSNYPPLPRHAPLPAFAKPGASTSSRNKRKYDAVEGGHHDRRGSGSARDSVKSSQKGKEPLSTKDKEGHFIVRPGDVLGHRYEIKRQLGQGTFGKVVAALDSKDKNEVAIKIIRAVPKYREASKVEVRVLERLRSADPDNAMKCIHLLDKFEYCDHVCLVTELLSASVFDFLKDNQYQAFPFSHIQHFARQLLESVAFLHKNHLIHTDLKPENILLEDASYTEDTSRKKLKRILRNTNIRLIDFGSATFESDYHATVVSTRHYRAPEIIIGTSWSYPCDVWSIGCILIEFYTGEALFQTHENLEHLAMMERVIGPMPETLVNRVFSSGGKDNPHQEWFKSGTKNGRPIRVLDFPTPTTSKQSIKFVKGMRTIRDTIGTGTIQHIRFCELLKQLLAWDPSKRITVRQALEHDFFKIKLVDEGTSG